MSLHQFITNILNIKPEQIQDLLTLNQSDGSMVIKIRLVDAHCICPYCNGQTHIHEYYPRKLTHSTFINRACTILYLQRRYRCNTCQITFNEPNSFTHSHESITHETKINILQDLKHPEITYTLAAKRNYVSKAMVLRIFDRHVHIARKPLPKVLSLDEHYLPDSDYESLYCCLLMDFVTGVIIDALPDRKKSYLLYYLSHIKHETYSYETHTSELDRIQYVSIDMSESFRSVFQSYCPKAIICADSFHVLQHLTKDFNAVRLKCRRETPDPVLAYLLMKFKVVLNHNVQLDNVARYNKRLKRYINLRGIQTVLFKHFPELKKAYELKEEYIAFNETASFENADRKLDALILKFADSQIREYDEFCTVLSNWKQEIVNLFTVVNGRRINNSHIESKNRQVQRLLNNANGFRNFKRTRNRILYCLNKEDTYTF